MKKADIFNGFTVFVALAVLLTFTLNMINGRFQLGDFRVYYTAATHLFSGGQVYLVSFDGGSGFYKYSPATLFFFLPYTFLNFKVAEIIHFFILGTAYWYTFILIRNLVTGYLVTNAVKHATLLLSLSFGCILIHCARELYLGNINIILLMLCCLAIQSLLAGKDRPGGILLGIVILVKPYLLILLIPLVLRKKWRAMAWLCSTAAFGLIIPFIFPGPSAAIGLYGDWIKTVMAHNGDFPGMTSIDYIFSTLIASWPSWAGLLIFALCSILVVLFILNNIHREKQQASAAGLPGSAFLFEWFLLVALLPNLIRTDWVLMLLSAPLLMFMIFYIASEKKYLWIPVLVILLFFYGANSDDLLGRALSHKILQSGLMGLGNFLLVLAALRMFFDYRKPTGINNRQQPG